MLTEAQFVAQQRLLGCRIHENDGIFWEEIRPFYCKPAFVHQPFNRGVARPAVLRQLFGYSHQVRDSAQANRWLSMMVVDRRTLDGFHLQQLPQKKRNNVRRARERCDVRPIVDIDSNLERLREINVAQALRHAQGTGSNTPPERYARDADDWRNQMRREFALEGREWWGAFVEGVLAAYLRTYQVNGIRIIQQTKADTAWLKFYPMDALYFDMLSRASADSTCVRIVNGSPLHPSLNHYKEQFLFRAVSVPYYSSNARMIEWAKRWRKQ
ncbi:MAG: hypothetical protein RBT03_03220 [Kiritimatiellia bacterium]|nr:hypothetical protein [Kiritimatiellia bacterium]